MVAQWNAPYFNAFVIVPLQTFTQEEITIMPRFDQFLGLSLFVPLYEQTTASWNLMETPKWGCPLKIFWLFNDSLYTWIPFSNLQPHYILCMDTLSWTYWPLSSHHQIFNKGGKEANNGKYVFPNKAETWNFLGEAKWLLREKSVYQLLLKK